ncbi:ester cyclase [Acidobacteria bacterium AB60]|nr:ester cyclase [Acidobacteria bacterium AB60]
MIRILLVFTVMMMATSAVEPQEVGGGNSNRMDPQATNKRAVTELFEKCFNQGDLERLSSLVAEEYQGPGGLKGPSAFASTISQIRSSLSGAHYEIQDMVGEDNRVAVRWQLTGKQDGPFRGYPASHNSVATTGMAIFALEKGKIVRSWLLTDQLGFLQQIGVLPREIKPPARSQEVPDGVR